MSDETIVGFDRTWQRKNRRRPPRVKDMWECPHCDEVIHKFGKGAHEGSYHCLAKSRIKQLTAEGWARCPEFSQHSKWWKTLNTFGMVRWEPTGWISGKGNKTRAAHVRAQPWIPKHVERLMHELHSRPYAKLPRRQLAVVLRDSVKEDKQTPADWVTAFSDEDYFADLGFVITMALAHGLATATPKKGLRFKVTADDLILTLDALRRLEKTGAAYLRAQVDHAHF